jgi:hypothetical protein
MNTRKMMTVGAVSAAAVCAAAGSANADMVLARGSSGSGLDATVMFQAVGSDLYITLKNTSLSDVLVPSDLLTGVFFDITGDSLELAAQGAVLDAESIVRWGSSEPDGSVGGEWAFRGGLSGAPGGAAYGISTAGFGLFGPHDSFPGANLDGQNGPQGMNYGLLSLGDDPLTGNAPVTGGNALIQSGVVFHLSGLPAGFDPGRIANVSVQYGTSLSQPSFVTPITSVPAPGGLVAMAIGGALVARRRRRV